MSSIVPVGIDLGTSFCVISFINKDGCSQIIRDDSGSPLTPSAVYFGEEGVTVGREAWEAALHCPERVAENVKRDMGLDAFRNQIDGHAYPPEVIQSCLLRRLHSQILEAVGENFAAVVTVPAYFDEARRKATCDAAAMSGLPVLDIVNEPTAAALAFGEKLGYLTPHGAPSQCLNILVYDLGGGTFDVTVVRLAASDIRVLATDGDCELGGVNWDQRLAELAKSRCAAIGIDPASFTPADHIRLQRAAEAAKHALTDRPLAVLEFRCGDKDLNLPVSRDEFEDLTEDLLERTLFTTKQTVQTAGLIWSDIDRVILVGGASRMPAVERALVRRSGLTVDRNVNPDEAVARGAAIYSRFLLGSSGVDGHAPELKITDVNSHGLGIEGVNLQTLRTENVIIIPRNTPLPCEVKRTFVTRTHGQPNVKIELLEGESSLPGQCSRLATARVKNLPPHLPQGTPIDVCYSLQKNGRLRVTAAVTSYGENAEIELQRLRGLEERRVQRWKLVVCRNGGLREFHDVLHYLAEPDAAVENADEPDLSVVGSGGARWLTEPAAAFGAPRAAATALQTHLSGVAASDLEEPSDDIVNGLELEDLPTRSPARPNARLKPRGPSAIGQIAGYVLGAAAGLALGYYVLQWLRPDLQF